MSKTDQELQNALGYW